MNIHFFSFTIAFKHPIAKVVTVLCAVLPSIRIAFFPPPLQIKRFYFNGIILIWLTLKIWFASFLRFSLLFGSTSLVLTLSFHSLFKNSLTFSGSSPHKFVKRHTSFLFLSYKYQVLQLPKLGYVACFLTYLSMNVSCNVCN